MSRDKKKREPLTHDEWTQIVKDRLLGKEPSVTGPAADAARASLEPEIQMCIEKGYAIDLPVDPDLSDLDQFMQNSKAESQAPKKPDTEPEEKSEEKKKGKDAEPEETASEGSEPGLTVSGTAWIILAANEYKGGIKTRKVTIPPGSYEDLLERIFVYGQNHYQNNKNRRSAVVGDVIVLPAFRGEYTPARFFVVRFFGFSELSAKKIREIFSQNNGMPFGADLEVAASVQTSRLLSDNPQKRDYWHS